MSIQSKINYIITKRNEALTEVSNKGVPIPNGAKIDDLPGLIKQIDTTPNYPGPNLSYEDLGSGDYYIIIGS